MSFIYANKQVKIQEFFNGAHHNKNSYVHIFFVMLLTHFHFK